MLILPAVRAILRDARMHEAAGSSRPGTGRTAGRGRTRRADQAGNAFRAGRKDIDEIQTSTQITSRGVKITSIDVAEDDDERPGLPGRAGH